jgi:AcrR family transcriptional regulator
VLDAARSLFAEQGFDAQMEDVARRAGVGVGTIYRHYPTKEALIQELLAERMRRLTVEARSARAEEPTPWDAFARFLAAVADTQADDRSLVQFIAGQIRAGDDLRRAQAELYTEMTSLIEAAQAEGSLRREIAPGDIPLLLSGVGRSIWITGEHAPVLTRRYLAVILDGLRAPGATSLPGHPLTLDDMSRILYRD